MELHKNKYGTDLLLIKEKVTSSHPKTIGNIKKHGKVYAYCHALEKWNHHKQDPVTKKWYVPSGPPWDVNGHQCEDIYVRLYLNPFSLDFYPHYLSKIKMWIKTSYEESLEDKVTIKGIKKFFSWLHGMRSYLYLYDDHWTFVIDSFQSLKDDIAEEILAEKIGDHEKALKLIKSNRNSYKQQYDQVYSELSHEFIENYLAKDYWQINSYMWVLKTDPTCFVINEKIRKFDLPTGWSAKEILNHLGRWYYWVVNERVEVIDVIPEEDQWQT